MTTNPDRELPIRPVDQHESDRRYTDQEIALVLQRAAEIEERRADAVVEEQLDATGTVTEVLGTVRWTSVARDHRFGSTMQVSLSVKNDETHIQVVQRHSPALRGILPFLPGVWGVIIGAGSAASFGAEPVAVLGSLGGGAALGVGIGRSIWQHLARRGAREVQNVAGELASAAREMAEG